MRTTSRGLVVAAAIGAVLASACGESPPDVVVQHVSMQLTDSSTGFGVSLVEHLLAEPGAGNVFVSPLSATLMLSMAASAAHGDTRAAMLKVLGLDPATDPSAEARLTIQRLAQSDSNVQLELAQAVWAQQGLTLSPAYVATLRNDYSAQIANLDFASPAAPAVVNQWVDAATHHKITQLVDQFDPGTVAFLVNATYFHALWAAEFNTVGEPIDFHTFAGQTVSVSMMRRSESVTELQTPELTAELLPYKGGRFSAVLLLPRQILSPAAFADFLNGAVWAQTLQYLHHAVGPSLGGHCKAWSGAPDVDVACNGTLVMPKFKLDYGVDLTKTLAAMGMPIPGAELPEICSGCFLTTVIQKTYLQVDEKGTTAAAATGGMVATALRIPTIVDHPFALALIDNATDAPIFLGAIGNL
ncbi:MAG: serpin family protein [Candidatus Dormiibacterota bacterium]